MNTIEIVPKLTDRQADRLGGTFLDDSHHDMVFNESVRITKPDGSLLAILIKNAIDPALCLVARDCLRKAALKSENRGLAAGIVSEEEVEARNKELEAGGHRSRFVREKNGRLYQIINGKIKSNVAVSPKVKSGIVGFFDRNARFPYCRQTKYLVENSAEVQKSLPFIERVDQVFREHAPERYQAQLEIVRRTHPDFVINKTAFTTITVNRNFRTACHQDAGDYRPGFGVLSVLQTGKYAGGLFVIPKYRVAFNMRTTDVLLADVHEWHGNTEIIPQTPKWERISCVFYYREKMSECGSAVEELQRARKTVEKRLFNQSRPTREKSE